jgi:hypothetical protein
MAVRNHHADQNIFVLQRCISRVESHGFLFNAASNLCRLARRTFSQKRSG